MRVLMLSWEYPPNMVGGLGRHVAELVPALVQRDIDVHILTPGVDGAPPREDDHGATIHRIPMPARSGGYPDFYTGARHANEALAAVGQRIIESLDPFDLIHNHDWLTAFAARDLKERHRLPMVATIHATERGRGRGQLSGSEAQRINDAEWELIYEAWRVITTTGYMAEELESYFSTPADKIDVIPNGIDPRRFQALEGADLSAFRARYALAEERLVLYVGRIVQEKGVEVLVRSMPLVLASVPEAKLVVAGKGPELDGIRQLAWELAVSHKILVPGYVNIEDRDRLYKVADCAVFPSLYEPFGIVALEAMAARTPVVASEVGGLREVVRHAETGITIYPNSPESCAWGIVHTLQHPEWARMRVENAYHEVLTVYNWDTIAASTIEIYERVVQERAATEW
jgi:glycogen synthase